MAGPVPYLYLPGTAREALVTYQKVFGTAEGSVDTSGVVVQAAFVGQ